jgi:hypothetical protein
VVVQVQRRCRGGAEAQVPNYRYRDTEVERYRCEEEVLSGCRGSAVVVQRCRCRGSAEVLRFSRGGSAELMQRWCMCIGFAEVQVYRCMCIGAEV